MKQTCPNLTTASERCANKLRIGHYVCGMREFIFTVLCRHCLHIRLRCNPDFARSLPLSPTVNRMLCIVLYGGYCPQEYVRRHRTVVGTNDRTEILKRHCWFCKVFAWAASLPAGMYSRGHLWNGWARDVGHICVGGRGISSLRSRRDTCVKDVLGATLFCLPLPSSCIDVLISLWAANG